ncbi:MAG: hypothetical protein ACKODK_12640 [Opitutaceae bacterium]
MRECHPPFRRRPSPGRRLLAAVVAVLVAPGPASALTLKDLLGGKDLTPKKFAAHFSDFDYEFGADVLSADVFLARRKGDCDDYAVLADHVLRHHRQTPRLIHVRMVGRVAHAVCYVTEAKAFLDYNNRKYAINVERCGVSLREIATQVAESFKANWTSVSEFTYSYEEERKRFGVTVVKTDSPSADPDRNPPAAKAAR